MTSPSDVVAAVKARVAWLRRRSPAFDHLVRALGHYNAVGGNQHAGAITYFSFLSFFPLVALGFAVLGWIGRVYPDAVDQALAVVSDYLPGLVGDGPGQINLQSIADAATTTTVLGLLGLLYAGLGWVGALREALQEVWATRRPRGNVVTRKLVDVGVLVALGLAVLGSVAVSSLATSATELVLRALNLQHSLLATVVLRLLAVGVALGADVFVLLVVFDRLPGRRVRWRNILRGAVLGAVLLEILKLLGTFLIGRATSNAVYGAFAVVVGLLIWLNFIGRVLLLSATWTATMAGGPVGAATTPVVAEPALPPPVGSAALQGTAPRRVGRLPGVTGTVAGLVVGLVAGRRWGQRRSGAGERD